MERIAIGYFSSPGRHALSFENCRGFRCFKVVEKGLSRACVLAVGGDAADEDQFVLQVAGEGAGKLYAGGEQHIGEKYAELGLAFGDRLRDRAGRGLHFALVLDLLCNTEPLEGLLHVSSGCTRWKYRDRLCLEYSRLQRLRCAEG